LIVPLFYYLLIFRQIPDCGLLCDLLWSDPDKDITGWSENDRGVSFTFGPDVVSRFLQKHDMDLICRAHQVVEDGYEFFSKRQLVTLFSAPNYCGEFDNAGAMMSVDESLLCSFQVSHSGSMINSFANTYPIDPETRRQEAKVRILQFGLSFESIGFSFCLNHFVCELQVALLFDTCANVLLFICRFGRR
jgi:hypothetical protein